MEPIQVPAKKPQILNSAAGKQGKLKGTKDRPVDRCIKFNRILHHCILDCLFRRTADIDHHGKVLQYSGHPLLVYYRMAIIHLFAALYPEEPDINFWLGTFSVSPDRVPFVPGL